MPARIAVTPTLSIGHDELVEVFVRASGPGGQHVNTTSTAVELRFDALTSPSLPDPVKLRLTRLAGRRMNSGGVLVITSDAHRSQQRNRADALDKLLDLLRQAAVRPRIRRATTPTLGSKKRRLAAKAMRSSVKQARQKGAPDRLD